MTLYNRYIPGAWPEPKPDNHLEYQQESKPDASNYADIPSSVHTAQKSSSALKGLFGGAVKLPDFDTDTILLLVLVYFLVADESENISDTLLIIGVLLLLGF